MTMLELLAEGRTAEVFAYGEGRVLKLDRPDWSGLSEFEGTLLAGLADAGLPVARPHGTVTVEGRSGLILDRVEGPSLLEVLLASGPERAEQLAGASPRSSCRSTRWSSRACPSWFPGSGARSRTACPTPRCAGSCWRC